MANPTSIKHSLNEYFRNETRVFETNGRCVVTLPYRTLDDRYPSVYVEERGPDYFIVHDGGKTISQLFLQGIHLTESRVRFMGEIASRQGAEFAEDRFTIGCTSKTLQQSILAIGQCATMGMNAALVERPVLAEDPIVVAVERGFTKWGIGRKRDIVGDL